MLILITTSTSHQITRSSGMPLAYKLSLKTAVHALEPQLTSSLCSQIPQPQWVLSLIRSLVVTFAQDLFTLTRFVLETFANSLESMHQHLSPRMRGSMTNRVPMESSVMGPNQPTGTSSSTHKAKQLIRSSWQPLKPFCKTRQLVPHQT
jgi:hypothetical protein